MDFHPPPALLVGARTKSPLILGQASLVYQPLDFLNKMRNAGRVSQFRCFLLGFCEVAVRVQRHRFERSIVHSPKDF